MFKAVPCKTSTMQKDAEFLQNWAGMKTKESPVGRARWLHKQGQSWQLQNKCWTIFTLA